MNEGEPWLSPELNQQVIHGAGSLQSLGSLAQETARGRTLLVSDRGVASAGHTETARRKLADSGVRVVVYSDSIENPTGASVEKAFQSVRKLGPFDLITAIGGGSTMDTAKGVNLLLTNGGKLSDYKGWNELSSPPLPMIGIPTTAGTGSEAQSYAVIADEESHLKFACGAPGLLFQAVILDPELTRTLPASVAVASFADAISHAVESFVSTRSSEDSRDFAGRAWRHLTRNVEGVLAEPWSLETKMDHLWGAYYAGVSIERSMLGAAHACANPLTATFGVTHGVAVAIMLPHVVRFNYSVAGSYYQQLIEWADPRNTEISLDVYLKRMNEKLGLPASLRDCGVESPSLEGLAEQAMRQWTGQFNPRPLEFESFLLLFEEALQA